MTARHQIRVGNRRISRDRAPIHATPAPSTGQMLQTAREKKGVDLSRAERDTKIRAKYLAALENGDTSQLPSPVYTKGFLRNYALYLGLDPDEVLTRWKSELVAPRRARPIVAPPPRPIGAPRRGLILTPGLFVGLLLVLGILAFAGYLAIQLFRFAQAPTLTVSQPTTPHVALQRDADRYVLSGTAAAGATIRIESGTSQEYRVTADASGNWSREVALTRGQNDFRVTAIDADTGKESAVASLIITVPLPVATAAPGSTLAPGMTAGPGAGPALPVAQLSVTSPTQDATLEDGVVAVSGTTNASSVTVTAHAAGTPGASPSAGPSTSPSAPASPGASPGAGDGPAPITITPVAGSFAGSISLPPGTWRLDVTSTGANLTSKTESRTVTVAYSGVSVVVEARRGHAWVKVWVDGKVAQGYAVGKVLRKGTSETFIGRRNVTVRTGNAGGIAFVVDGVDKGIVGRPGAVESWLFQPGRDPVRTAAQ